MFQSLLLVLWGTYPEVELLDPKSSLHKKTDMPFYVITVTRQIVTCQSNKPRSVFDE